MTKNQRVQLVNKYIKSFDKYFGKFLFVKGAADLIGMQKDCKSISPEQQLSALEKTWDLSSSLGMSKIYPAYNIYMDKALKKIIQGVRIINWDVIKKNVNLAVSIGVVPKWKGVEFSGKE